MARQKRAAISQSDQSRPPAKKVRSSRVSGQALPVLEVASTHTNTEASVQCDDSDLTARNAQESPLLRLPAELRERIWTYAFGNRTVHPRGDGDEFWDTGFKKSLKRSSPKRYLLFHPCEEPVLDDEAYKASLQGQSDTQPHQWKHPGMQPGGAIHRRFVGLHYCSEWNNKGTTALHEYLVAPICKQLYYEALPVAWKTTTFSFSEPDDLRQFVRSRNTRLDLITQLCIIYEGDPYPFNHGDTKYKNRWPSALKSTSWVKFTSLQGLNVILKNHCWQYRHVFRPPGLNVMKAPPYYCEILPDIIRHLQNFPLLDSRTTVLVADDYYGRVDPGENRFSVSERRAMAEAIRTLLLQRTQKKAKRQPKWAQQNKGTRRSERLKDAK